MVSEKDWDTVHDWNWDTIHEENNCDTIHEENDVIEMREELASVNPNRTGGGDAAPKRLKQLN